MRNRQLDKSHLLEQPGHGLHSAGLVRHHQPTAVLCWDIISPLQPSVRVMRPWHSLPREAVAAPSLAVFKARLVRALSNLGWWKVSLPVAGGLDDL